MFFKAESRSSSASHLVTSSKTKELKEAKESTQKTKSAKVSSSNKPGDKVVELNNKKNSGESKKQSMTGTTPGMCLISRHTFKTAMFTEILKIERVILFWPILAVPVQTFISKVNTKFI